MTDLTTLQPATLGIIVFIVLIVVRVGLLWLLASAAAGLATANYARGIEWLIGLWQGVLAEFMRMTASWQHLAGAGSVGNC